MVGFAAGPFRGSNLAPVLLWWEGEEPFEYQLPSQSCQ